MQNRAVTLTGRPLHLTLKEFDLLAQFAGHPGRVYTRTQLLNAVWGYGYDGLEHTVNSHINRLRSELERDPANLDYIQTVWGGGLPLRADPSMSCPGCSMAYAFPRQCA